jgi:TupA-like ATPgrasp
MLQAPIEPGLPEAAGPQGRATHRMSLRKRLQPAHRAIAAALPLATRRSYLYAANHGRLPNTRAPRTFTEKVNWRILRDRREQFDVTCDKDRMKVYASERSPSQDLRVPATLWLGADVQELVGLDLRGDWVLKPNHRSGQVLFGSGPVSQSDVKDLQAQTAGWLSNDQWHHLGEWAYDLARPAIMLEARIAPGVDLSDFKFFVFDGQPKLIQVDSDRFTRHTRNLYTPDWKHVNVRNRYPIGLETTPPDQLALMLKIAGQLGAGWDFMRIDLYAHDQKIWFGEISPYPGGGVEPYKPRSFDIQLGNEWALPSIFEKGTRGI